MNNINKKNEFNEDNEEREYISGDKERYQNNDMDNNNKFYSYMIIEPINKSYKNIFSDDLDGWDEPIEEYS